MPVSYARYGGLLMLLVPLACRTGVSEAPSDKTGSRPDGNSAVTLGADQRQWEPGPYCKTNSDCPQGHRCLELVALEHVSQCFRFCRSDRECKAGEVCLCNTAGCSYSWATGVRGTNYCTYGRTPEQKRLEEEMGPRRPAKRPAADSAPSP
jgi:hypothetical protein